MQSYRAEETPERSFFSPSVLFVLSDETGHVLEAWLDTRLRTSSASSSSKP